MLQVTINKADLERVKSTFSGMQNIQNKVLSRAINLTLTGVRTDAAKEIGATFNLAAAKIKEAFTFKKATVSQVNGAAICKGKTLGLINFGARQTQKGVTIKIKKNSSRTTLYHAFIATSKGGEQVFTREYKGARSKTGKKAIRRAWKSLPKMYRLPVKALKTSRIPDIFSNDPVMQAVMAQANARLHTNINHEIDFEFSKLKAT